MRVTISTIRNLVPGDRFSILNGRKVFTIKKTEHEIISGINVVTVHIIEQEKPVVFTAGTHVAKITGHNPQKIMVL